jgi:hypothetical protein
MGLKGYMLWSMGQLDSNVQSPTTVLLTPSLRYRADQIAFIMRCVVFDPTHL